MKTYAAMIEDCIELVRLAARIVGTRQFDLARQRQPILSPSPNG